MHPRLIFLVPANHYLTTYQVNHLMKNLLNLSILLLLTLTATAQSPQKMSYQAVIRDGSNALVQSQTVGMQISILQGSITGTAVYVETHSAVTNANGLVSIEIGGGAVTSGSFATVDWANGPFFVSRSKRKQHSRSCRPTRSTRACWE